MPSHGNVRLGQPVGLLRGVATVLLACFIWSFTLAPVALAAQPVKPMTGRGVTPMTVGEMAHLLASAHQSPASHLATMAAHMANMTRGKGKRKPGLPTLQEFLRQHQASQENAARRARLLAAKAPKSPGSLLDEVGHLAAPVSATTVAGWKRELHTGAASAHRAALLNLWLGEYLLAHDQHPQAANLYFRTVQALTTKKDPLSGAAAYDIADGLFYDGAYQAAADQFAELLNPKNGASGFDRANCALWLRHARACAGYHAERANMGIPEPPQLDRYCGAAALAACLRGLDLPADRKTVLAACKVTGEGSSLQDIVNAHTKLGVSIRTLTATDEGLRALPKPLIAFVETDHFIAVTRADNSGVTYLCSDCGAWPGGQVHLSWKQWHALAPGIYAAVTRPGSAWDQELAAQPGGSQPGAIKVASQPVRVAMNGSLGRVLLHVPSHPLLRGVQLKLIVCLYIHCGFYNRFTLHCGKCVQCCIMDFLIELSLFFGSSFGDPVNLATGEEEYTPAPDLTVYNPHGPSVNWGRIYNSLRSAGEFVTGSYEFTDFGYGWSTPYNVAIVSSNLVLDNGAYIGFTTPSAPTAGHPVQCSVQPGAPLLMECDYSAGGNYYTVTWKDHTRWVLVGGQLSQIIDRSGNAITFNYVPASNFTAYSSASFMSYPLLSTITNQNGTKLLTVTRNTFGSIAAVSDCYGRSVFYHMGQYGERFALDFVSEVAPSCAANPAARYLYAYQMSANPEGGHATPLLNAITVPSPTGNGSSTSTITYDSYMYVTSLSDANGNTHSYTATDANHEKVTVTDAHGNVAHSYTGSFDNAMSGTGKTDGAGRITSAEILGDPNDPYRPSLSQDGNACQAYTDSNPRLTPGQTASLNQVGGSAPTSGNTWDILSPSGAVVAKSSAPAGWSVTSNFKDSVPSSMTVTVPTGATLGNGYTARVAVSFIQPNYSALFDVISGGAGYGTTTHTWDAYGNMLTETSPRGITTTYTYDYSHFALGELTGVQEGTKTATTYAYDHADGYVDSTGTFVPCGLVTSIKSPTPGSASGSGSQVTTAFTYDVTGQGSQAMGSLGLGNILSVTTPGNNATLANGVDQGITTTFAYTGDGTGITSASIGKPLTVTDNLGKTTHLRYDAQGQTTATMDALGNETDIAYNEGGGSVSLGNQAQSVTLPATGQTGGGHGGSVTGYLYPGGPALSTTTYDESGHAIRQVNTTYGKEGETLSASGSTEPVSYTYDGLYRLSTLKDGGNHVTSYFYNTYGYLAQVVYPGAGTPPTAPLTAGSSDTTTYNSYDADGNLTSRTDGRNQTTTYSYTDNESRLTDITYPSGTIGSVHLHYDGYGRRDTMSDGTGSQTYSYDDANDLTSKSVTWTGLSAKTISYAFYANGSRQTMTADGNAFSYGYDKDGRMNALTNPYSEPSAWTYRDNGWLSAKALGNASSATVATTTYTQNAQGEVTDMLNQNGSGATLSEFGSMAYDGAGNRTTLTASVPSTTAYSGTTSYAYDYGQTATASLNRSQVTGETSTRNGGYTNTFSFDGGTSTGAGNPTSFKGTTNTFNADNQITSTGYAYDSAGNPTTYQSHTLTFDPENRMTSYAGTTQTDGYSGDGLRAWKTNSGGTTYFLYDGSQPVCEYNGSGTLTATNTFGADGLVSRHTSSASTFYVFDERGNVTQRLNSSSTVQSSDLYDGYGAKSSTGGADVWGFEAQAGYYNDSETGLLLLTYRDYDPAAGRFLTRDPSDYDGGINLYNYVENNPIDWIDPDGNAPRSGPKVKDGPGGST